MSKKTHKAEKISRIFSQQLNLRDKLWLIRERAKGEGEDIADLVGTTAVSYSRWVRAEKCVMRKSWRERLKELSGGFICDADFVNASHPATTAPQSDDVSDGSYTEDLVL